MVAKIAIILPVIFALISVAAADSLQGVDPNTLACDPQGHIFLLLPHFEDCSKYYMCAHGNEVEFACDPALIFDFEKQTCNWPRNVECQLRTQPDEDDLEGSGEDEYEWLSDKAYVGESLTADSANGVRPLNIEAPAKAPSFNTNLNCLRADSASRQVAYKGDCQRYWRCLSGVPHVFYCNDGLFFNEQAQQCDFEANVKCAVQQEDELQGEFIVYK